MSTICITTKENQVIEVSTVINCSHVIKAYIKERNISRPNQTPSYQIKLILTGGEQSELLSGAPDAKSLSKHLWLLQRTIQLEDINSTFPDKFENLEVSTEKVTMQGEI